MAAPFEDDEFGAQCRCDGLTGDDGARHVVLTRDDQGGGGDRLRRGGRVRGERGGRDGDDRVHVASGARHVEGTSIKDGSRTRRKAHLR